MSEINFVETSAPSNIALIKYMGKTQALGNFPTNSSLSLTLDNLRTFIKISELPNATKDEWKPLVDKENKLGLLSLELSEKSKERFLRHFQMLKEEWGIAGNFLIESGNNFPSDCGLASSASSFAALTKAAVELFQKLKPNLDFEEREAVELSRKGSGSSCRSFYGPWSLWHEEGVRPLEFPFNNLTHQVVIVESAKKEVSSSEAHKRVSSSSLFQNRPERAEKRLMELIEAFRSENWKKAYEICWTEFWDMHALFETSQPPFGYMEPGTIEVLKYIKKVWDEKSDGPIVTMDAGANVHFIWRHDQSVLASEVKKHLEKKYQFYVKENN